MHRVLSVQCTVSANQLVYYAVHMFSGVFKACFDCTQDSVLCCTQLYHTSGGRCTNSEWLCARSVNWFPVQGLYTGGRSAPVLPPFLSLCIDGLVCAPPAARDHWSVRRMRRMAWRRMRLFSCVYLGHRVM